MKVLVTGGSGFIGSHLVDELLLKNHEVVNIDDLSADNDKFYTNKNAKNINHSILNESELNKAMEGCEFVFHLAAESRLQQATENPEKAVEVNVKGTVKVLEACRRHNVKGLLFSSTSSVYGLADTFPITETHKENCLNPYASTKYAAELLIKNFYELHGFNSCIFRYFNVFGERAPDKGPYALVTGIFKKQKQSGLPLTIVGDGKQKRDFIYVKDVVSANIMCMEQWNKPEINSANVFNVSSGKDIEILELAKCYNTKISFMPKRKGEAINNLASNEKLSKLTGWKPFVNIREWIKFYENTL